MISIAAASPMNAQIWKNTEGKTFLVVPPAVAIQTGQTQAAVTEKDITIFGQKMHYYEAGTGPETVVLVHGMGGNGSNWATTMALLSAKYHVVAPDLVGFGKSDKPLINYRPATFADFLDRFMTEVKIDKAHIVGHSLGGWIATIFASTYPQRVGKLVLLDAAGIFPGKNYDVTRLELLQATTRAQIRELLKLVVANSAPLMNDATVDYFLTTRLSAGDGFTIRALVDSAKRGEDFVDARLANIKAPTLIIWGKQDMLLTVSEGEKLSKGIAGSQFVVIDGAGHGPNVEKPAEFHAALTKFLDAK
jgi:pimeloyl-ACP methyl ester carboxylesterase